MGMKGRRSSAGVASTLLAAMLVLSFLPASARPLHRVDETPVEPCSASRRDTVLAWDDGNYGSIYDGVTGQAGMALAVMFQAPPWANYITEIQYFIMVDGTVDPTEALAARVWKPDPDMLPEYPAVEWQFVAGGYPKDAWLEVTLTQPVDITDPAEFPDRIFFVGLTWWHMYNPIIGIDLDPPIDCHSYRGYEPGWWELLVEADAMVRVVVAESATPVEPASWTMIKALWR
jgi:hypothetical protein